MRKIFAGCVSDKIPVRLCKGAYKEPASVAFPKKADVDANYLKLMRILFDHGTYPAIATHDDAMLDAAFAYVRERRIRAMRSSSRCCTVFAGIYRLMW